MIVLVAISCFFFHWWGGIQAFPFDSEPAGHINIPARNLETYHIIFGKQLQEVFATNATLSEASRQVATRPIPPGDLRFGCSSYESGSNLAARSREQSPSDLYPVLVDENDDKMCFIMIGHRENEHEYWKEMQIINFPEGLKIHDSVYDVIYEKASLNDAAFLMISFRQESLGSEPFQHNVTVENLVRSKIAELNDAEAHKTTSKFFWSSKESREYFESVTASQGNDRDFAEDYKRHKKWVHILSPFMHEEEHTYSYSESHEGICNLGSLNKYLEFDAGLIKFHVSQYSWELDKNAILPCFALIVAHLSLFPFVNHLALQADPVLLNFRARSIPQTSRVGSEGKYMPYTTAGLLGDEQIISIADTGVDSLSCYFYDNQGQVKPTSVSSPYYDMKYRKVIQYLYNGCGDTSDGAGGHGTHVAGIAVGCIVNADITSDGMYDGVAPNAKLSFSDFGKPGTGLCIPNTNQLYGPGYAAGARVHSNSWGSYFSGNGYYAGQPTDAYLYATQSMAIFFAAGNAGSNGNGDRTITIDASAKNVIAVGSSETTLGSTDIDYVAFYSSKGPTYDGRFKPDLVFPGDGLMSANAAGTGKTSCSTIQMTGTSMATPGAAGTALLLRQYFIDPNSKFWRAVCNRNYRSCKSFTPSGPLIKALLLNSGSRMQLFAGGGQYDVKLGIPPDYIQGFGRVSLWKVLPLKGVNEFDLFVADAVNIQENSEIAYTVEISDSSLPLKATIAWYDPPAVQGSTSKALINNLDLSAISPSNKRIYPNGRSSPDTVNVNERLNISDPQRGTWKVIVNSRSLPVMGNQLFAIVITCKGKVGYV